MSGCFDICDEQGLFGLLGMDYLPTTERNHGSKSIARLAAEKIVVPEGLKECEVSDDELCWMDD